MMRGIPLPPLGSLEFNLISEGILREKAEKCAFAKLLVDLVTLLGNIDIEKAKLMFSTFVEEVYQLKYNYKYEPLAVRVVTEKMRKDLEDRRILQKVAAMTVEEPSSNAGKR